MSARTKGEMATLTRECIDLMSPTDISGNLTENLYIYEEFLKERETVQREIKQHKNDLRVIERTVEKQKQKLERLKFFIDNETEQKEQLELTLTQNSRPANVKEKIQSTKDQLNKYREEEGKIFSTHLDTLQSIREINALILDQTEKLIDLDTKISCKKKNVLLLKQGQNRLKWSL